MTIRPGNQLGGARLALAVLLLVAGGGPEARLKAAPVISEAASAVIDPQAGKELVARMLAERPAEQARLTGQVKIRRFGYESSPLPFAFTAAPAANGWTAQYETLLSPTNAAYESLRIDHARGRTNDYWQVVARPATSGWTLLTNRVLYPTNHFGGSDFFLGDLGLEFLHWQAQTVIKKEMKRGRFCHVLESKPGPADRSLGYSKVISWVDNETHGIIQADAHDRQGKLLKQFELNSFKKVDGQWRLEEMEIRNVQAKSRTRLTFDLSGP